jgi:pimeloyl-ACP methyl ester carboxylesterase
MAKLESHTVDSAAGPQNVLVAGSGTPLLLLHGMGAAAASWSAVGEALSAEYRVVIPDLAGHGASAPSTGSITFAIQLGALEAILHAECAEPAILVGHSLGGWLACLLTLNHPELVRRVVLVNGPLLLPWPEGLSLIPNDRAGAARLFAATSSSTSSPVGDAMLDAYIAYAKTGPISRFIYDLEAWQPYLLDDSLHRFPRPVDLIWGMDDELVSFANAEILLARLPNARATRLEGCGHLPHIDCAERFMQALRATLERPEQANEAS